MTDEQSSTASGVEALIERLKQEGIATGQSKAEDIVLNAQKRAEWIIAEAEQEAQQLLDETQKQTDAMLASGNDALQLAARDALIGLRDLLLNSFSEEITRVVGKQMQQPEFLQQLILSLAGSVREQTAIDQCEQLTVHLPEDVIGIEELKQKPNELEQGMLSVFTASIAGDMLRKGIKLELNSDLSAGLFIQLQEQGMLIDFSDETVAALLLQHLQPRFRALLQGIIK